MKNKKIIIGDVCKLNSEIIGSRNSLQEINYLDTSNITKNIVDKIQTLNKRQVKFPSRAQRKVKKDTIIYSTVRPALEHFGFLENPIENLIVSTGFVTINTIDKDIDPKFLYYALTRKEITKYLQNIAINNVSSYPSINPDDIGSIAIDVPSDKSVQQKIAYALSILDSKIELNTHVNNELEMMAKTLYEYWFVQFDYPNSSGKPYKASGGNMVWNKELKRKIPEGWTASKIGSYIDINKGGDWGEDKPSTNHPLIVSCIRGTDINGLNGNEKCDPPTRYIQKNSISKILNSHDLVIEISGGSPTQSTGRLSFIIDSTLKRFNNPLVCSNFCRAITLKNIKYLYIFNYFWNSLYDNGNFFNHEGKTSGIKNLLFDSFINSHYMIRPEESIVNKFYETMTVIHNKKQAILAENQQLERLRDWLLPMLMNGQVKVEAEKIN